MAGKTAARQMVERALILHPELGGTELVLGAAAENYYRQAELKEPFNPEPALRVSLFFPEEGDIQRATGDWPLITWRERRRWRREVSDKQLAVSGL